MYVKKKKKSEVAPFVLEALPETQQTPEKIVLPEVEESVFSNRTVTPVEVIPVVIPKETVVAEVITNTPVEVEKETESEEPAEVCYEITCLDENQNEITLFSLTKPEIEQEQFIIYSSFKKGEHSENILGKQTVSVQFVDSTSYSKVYQVGLNKGLFIKAIEKPSWLNLNEKDAFDLFNEKSLLAYREQTKNLKEVSENTPFSFNLD